MMSDPKNNKMNKNNMIQLIMSALESDHKSGFLDAELKPLKEDLSGAVYQESEALSRLTAVKDALATGDEAQAKLLAEQWLASLQQISDLSPNMNPVEALNSCLHQHQRQLQIVETNAHVRQVTAMVKGVRKAKVRHPSVKHDSGSNEKPADAEAVLNQIRHKD